MQTFDMNINTLINVFSQDILKLSFANLHLP